MNVRLYTYVTYLTIYSLIFGACKNETAGPESSVQDVEAKGKAKNHSAPSRSRLGAMGYFGERPKSQLTEDNAKEYLAAAEKVKVIFFACHAKNSNNEQLDNQINTIRDSFGQSGDSNSAATSIEQIKDPWNCQLISKNQANEYNVSYQQLAVIQRAVLGEAQEQHHSFMPQAMTVTALAALGFFSEVLSKKPQQAMNLWYKLAGVASAAFLVQAVAKKDDYRISIWLSLFGKLNQALPDLQVVTSRRQISEEELQNFELTLTNAMADLTN